MDESRQPLLDMITNMSHPDMLILFRVLDIAHGALIYETTEEMLLMGEFMTSLWIAAKGEII